MPPQNVGLQYDSPGLGSNPATIHTVGPTIMLMEHEEENAGSHSPATVLNRTGCTMLPVYGGVFLAPIVIVLGFTADHGNSWKIMFLISFASWMINCTIGLLLDLRRLERQALIKRSLWHLGGCGASLCFATSVLHITSDSLPQWLPTIINCGLGTSVGVQNIPADSQKRLWGYICKVMGSIFGGTQVILQ